MKGGSKWLFVGIKDASGAAAAVLDEDVASDVLDVDVLGALVTGCSFC